MNQKKLYRSCKNQILGGVAGGLGEYLDFDPTIVRLIMALMIFSGFGVLFYIIAWLIIPLDPSCKSKQTGADEIKEHAERVASEIRKTAKGVDESVGRPPLDDIKIWIGILLLAFGFMVLFENLFGINMWYLLWPSLLIVAGFIIMNSSIRAKK